MPGAEGEPAGRPRHGFSLDLGAGVALRLREPHHVGPYSELVARNSVRLAAAPVGLVPAGSAGAGAHTDLALAEFVAGTGWEADLVVGGALWGAVRLSGLRAASGSVELGYWLAAGADPDLALVAVTGAVRQAFAVPGVARVCLRQGAADGEGARVAAAVGFRLEAVLRRAQATVGGDIVDQAVHGLLREEFADATPVAAAGRRFAMPVDAGLELALPERGDAGEVSTLAARNREQLRPWMPWADSISPAAQLSFIEGRALPAVRSGDGFEALIVERGRVVGMAGLHSVDPAARSGALGYWLDDERRGRGVVTRCVRAIVARCFESGACGGRPFERVEIQAGAENAPSRAVAERLGFALEGVVRHDQSVGGTDLDMAVYGLLRGEWRAGGGAGGAAGAAP